MDKWTRRSGHLGRTVGAILAVFVFSFILTFCSTQTKDGQASGSGQRFEISIPAAENGQPRTGRVFVMVSRGEEPEPRLQVGSWGRTAPFFGADVENLSPGTPAVIDGTALGYPVKSLRDIPLGDYYVQALFNVYTEFKRSDGQTVWAHMDQWEGQQFNRSPGNLYSETQKVRLDAGEGYTIKLSLDKVIPPIEVPMDTEWVKRVKIQSRLLSEFWGQPIYLGATILLPKGYETHPDSYYPVVYVQGHFSLAPPFRFSTEPSPMTERSRLMRERTGLEPGYEFYQAWNSDDFPRMIAVTFQHPTPYFDDSYAVNSANNGPFGDALMTELIPYLEKNFRILAKPYARVLTGGSTGGWESLALQVYHPEFFGGTWTFYPDPIDFRAYCLSNIYEDDNAFGVPGREWLVPERYFRRDPSGQPEVSMRQLSQLEEVLGTRGRSGQQLEIWEAVYGPVGQDGYPKPLWDKLTGKIDREVADYMRDNGYDLRHYIETNWPKIGPQLVGKLHIYCGDMDDYYLNLAVYMLEDFLKNTKEPYYAGSFEYGRPMKGHGWHPMTGAEMCRMMAAEIAGNAPAGEDRSLWRYD
jgi:hypothetical protein